MEQTAMMALAKELAKSLKTEADLNDFSRMLKKLTIETAQTTVNPQPPHLTTYPKLRHTVFLNTVGGAYAIR